MCCDNFEHALFWSMYTKKYTANFAQHGNIYAKFQANQIISATAIASHTDKNRNIFPYISCSVLSLFCASLYTCYLDIVHQ